MIRRFVTTLSLFLVTVYSANVVLAPLAEASIWEDRNKSIQLASLPLPSVESPRLQMPLATSNWGATEKIQRLHLPGEMQSLLNSIPLANNTIQDIYSSGDSSQSPILVIQDVHLNSEAQTNIAATLQSLIDKNKVGMIGVEGAFSPLNFGPFRSFDLGLRKKVSDAYLNINRLAAPSFVGITSSIEPPTFLGIDDKTHYKNNVSAYLNSQKQKVSVSNQLQHTEKELTNRKAKTFAKELKEFDDLRKAYHRGQVGLGAYLKKITARQDAPIRFS